MRSKDLQPTSPLPDLDGDRLDFLWDYERAGGEEWSVLRLGSKELWREYHVYGPERLFEVEAILRRRYRRKFGSLVASDASTANLKWPWD